MQSSEKEKTVGFRGLVSYKPRTLLSHAGDDKLRAWGLDREQERGQGSVGARLKWGQMLLLAQ